MTERLDKQIQRERERETDRDIFARTQEKGINKFQKSSRRVGGGDGEGRTTILEGSKKMSKGGLSVAQSFDLQCEEYLGLQRKLGQGVVTDNSDKGSPPAAGYSTNLLTSSCSMKISFLSNPGTSILFGPTPLRYCVSHVLWDGYCSSNTLWDAYWVLYHIGRYIRIQITDTITYALVDI